MGKKNELSSFLYRDSHLCPRMYFREYWLRSISTPYLLDEIKYSVYIKRFAPGVFADFEIR